MAKAKDRLWRELKRGLRRRAQQAAPLRRKIVF